VGLCEAPGFTTAGSHLDLGPAGSNLPVDANHPYHTGDIPNLIVSSLGNGFLTHISSRITLSPGPLSIFDANGSAVIVHLNPDPTVFVSKAYSYPKFFHFACKSALSPAFFTSITTLLR
jgi:Cu/Zn superoxide dismutase